MSETDEETITKKTCTRCGASWFPKKPGRPAGCAKCHSPYWDKPRVYELRNRAPARSRAQGAAATLDRKADTTPVITAEPPRVPPAFGRAGEALEAYRRMKAAQQGEA